LFDEVAAGEYAVSGTTSEIIALDPPFGLTNERFREIRLGSVIVSMWKQRMRMRLGQNRDDNTVEVRILRPDRTLVRGPRGLLGYHLRYVLADCFLSDSDPIRAYIDLGIRRGLLKIIDVHGHDFDEEARP